MRNGNKKRLVVLPILFLLLFSACAKEGEDYVEYSDIVDTFPIEAEPVKENPQQAEDSNLFAVFHTSAGEITVMLYPEESPKEVERFRRQAEEGLYNGQLFVYVRRGGLIECDNVPEDSVSGESDSLTTQDSGEIQGDSNRTEGTESDQTGKDPAYSDNLHHYYGSVGVSQKNEKGGDRLHFIVEQTKPEDERLVPANLYMNELINQRMAELNNLEEPMSEEELAEFETELNQEIAGIGTNGVPEEYAQKYQAAKETYDKVGGQWSLDYQYPVIGQIVEGLNVADAISQAKVTATTRQPKQDIVIKYVEIVEK